MNELVGFTVAACKECGCDANSYHYPGCSGAPYVCPGCYAIGGERCAGYCPDAAIARDREASELERDREEREDFDPMDLNDGEDWEWNP
jgi:hypothetical protein